MVTSSGGYTDLQGAGANGLAPKSVGDVLQLVGRAPLVMAKRAPEKGSAAVDGSEDTTGKDIRTPEQLASLKLLRDALEVEEARQAAAAKRKRRHRRQYDIGWRVERIPRNAALATKLGCPFLARHGHCCLVLDPEARTVRVAECARPASCVNLEYLALALQVRLDAGREPLFSLEPLSTAKDPRRSMQVKRFEPEWLMGTSLGEVMFQADYHLKELSFGEYEQPVAGMRSTFDFHEAEGLDKEWTARAWFVVNSAEVMMTDGNVLVPRVEMGVEAREQMIGEHGATDVPVTRPDHPMVKYAAAFTHNFDLIAERKSVVYHLREVAKASVLAKFMVEAGVHVDDSWFGLVDWAAVKEAATGCCLEIPQLWKDRCHSEICEGERLKVGTEEGANMNLVSLYGGVEFGLSRFNIAPANRLPSFIPSEEPARPSLFAPARRAVLDQGVNLELIRAGGQVLQKATEMARAGVPRPEGVDLNLDQFDLSEPTRTGSPERVSEALLSDGDFWAQLDKADGAATAQDEDLRLLKNVFNPSLSDRRSEGDCFVPPDTSARYLKKLQRLVQEERAVQHQRKEHFFDQGFQVGRAGEAFPSSWSFSAEAVREDAGLRRHPCDHTELDESLLRSATTVVTFDKSTEDGLRFRIYRSDGIEVRTVQEGDAAEVIGAAFTTQECGTPLQGTEKREGKSVKVIIASIGPAAVPQAQECAGSERKAAPAAERKERLAQLIHSSGHLCGDREVVLAAVEHDGLALARAAPELRADREVVLAAVERSGRALEFACKQLRADRDLVLAAVQQNASALEFASQELRLDQDIASAALLGASPEQLAAAGLRGDRELLLAAVRRSPLAFELASDGLRAERGFALAAVQCNALVLESLSRELRADPEFMMQVVSDNGFALKYAAPELRARREIVEAAVAQDRRALEHASRELQLELAPAAAAASPAPAAGPVVVAAVAEEPWGGGADEASAQPGQEEDEEGAAAAPIWVVVGGGALGGIVVRKGEDPASEAMLRLAQGARIKELKRVGERMQFEKLSGEGPDAGWVSAVLNGKEMLARA